MPPRRRAPAPIPVDIEGVRRKLAEGKIVRVGVSKSAQFPDGATGRVRHVGDPAVDGEEFVQVELSLNGMRDVLPFTPSDLTPATRGRPPGSSDVAAAPRPAKASAGARGAGTAKPARKLTSVPTGEMLADSPDRQSAAAAKNAGVGGSAAAGPGGATTPGGAAITSGAVLPTNAAVPGGPAARDDATASGGPAAATGGRVAPGSVTPPTEHGSTGGQPSGKPKPARGTRRTPAVAITIATTDTEPTLWKIEARVGARVALRSGSVAPARVWELVRLLENEALTKAVGSILEDQRKAAQARADSLAAELAQVQAELDALPDGSQ